MKIAFLVALGALTSMPSLRAQTASGTLPAPADQARADSSRPVGMLTPLPARERGAAVTSIDARNSNAMLAPSLPIALQGRVPGASISEGEGFLGSTSRLWLRGPSSFLVNRPLIIIDGARAHAAQIPRGFEGAELPSMLEDIDPEMVERIEVLPGIAASAIYGPGASKGVILVTTRRGRAGPAQWSGFAATGPMIDATDFPANFGTLGVATSGGAPVANCPLADQAAGTCTPTTRQSWNPLENASPFRTGWSSGAGIGASGGAGGITYYGAVNHERATGVYDRDRGNATNGLINVAMAPTPLTDVRLTAGFHTEHYEHPPVNYLFGGLRGNPVDDPVNRGYRFLDPEELATGRRTQDGNRTTIALTGEWRPRGWLRTTASFGYDRLVVDHTASVRRAGLPIPGIPGSGDPSTYRSNARDLPATASGGVEAEVSYVRGLPMQTTVGIQYIQDDDRGDARAWASEFDFSMSNFHIRRATTGAYLRQHAGWNDRLFLTGIVRGDVMRDGPPGLKVLSGSIDGAWVVVRQSVDVPSSSWLGELRLRGAYGVGGGHLIPSISANAMSTPSVESETSERMKELEAGFDALLGTYARVSVTAYRATNDEVLLTVPPPVSGGFQSYMNNGGNITTSGIEGSLDTRLLALGEFHWDLGLVGAFNRHEVRRLPVPSFSSDGQYYATGSQLGEYRSGAYTYVDSDGDGMIAPSEVTYDPAAYTARGAPIPSRVGSLRTIMGFGGHVDISAQLDHRAGHELLNQVALQRCWFEPRCVEQHDPETPLAAQAGAVATRAMSSMVSDYIEDASYTKLREVSVAIALPTQWATMAGTSRARLTLMGRNLVTWTSYSGLDPEVITTAHDGVAGSGGFYQPPLRTFSARVDLSW